jgi:hypothetical protein
VPYRARSLVGHLIALVRWPVLAGLGAAFLLQFAAAFAPDIKPDQLVVPDLIPPLNTAVLALLWWRVAQLEKFKDRQDDRDYREDHDEPRRKHKT